MCWLVCAIIKMIENTLEIFVIKCSWCYKMKKVFVFLMSFVLLLNATTCFAIVLGDVDNDSYITMNDARYALRVASGIELCDVDSDKFKLIDFDEDKIISLSDVRRIMLIATGVSESVIDGIKVTTLPVEFNGLTINSLSIDGSKVTINVTNNTGKTIDELSSISYKCYDSNGTILKTASVYLEDMNNGENCNAFFYIEAGTTKILFTGGKVSSGEYKEETQTSLICGLNVTSLPFTFNGLTINSLSIDGSKVTINVTNNTGKAIDELSSISYKCYDSNGTILKTASVYLEDMNNGENCNAFFYIEAGTTKILFTGGKVSSGEYKEETPTSLMCGLNVTTLPITFNGLTINSFSLDNSEATINVTNNTGKAVDEISSISYKCYDSNGTILKTASVYLEDMNNGENCNAFFYIEAGTTKILFTGANVHF